MSSQKFSNVQRIKIKSSANVSIIKGDQFYVHISGDDAEEVKVSQSDDEVEIECCESNGGNFTNFIGGDVAIGNINIMQIGGKINNQTVMRNSTVGGKSISIINGEVFVNGKRQVDEGSSSTSDEPAPPARKPVQIEIRCPNGLAIECVLTGDAVLGAFPEFKEARIVIEGVGEARIQSRAGKLKIAGAGDINYKSLGGNLKMNINCSGNIKAYGDFKDVDASINGSGNIITDGNVSGDYEANICGCGDIKHSGRISGEKHKSISGTGSVRW